MKYTLETTEKQDAGIARLFDLFKSKELNVPSDLTEGEFIIARLAACLDKLIEEGTKN